MKKLLIVLVLAGLFFCGCEYFTEAYTVRYEITSNYTEYQMMYDTRYDEKIIQQDTDFSYQFVTAEFCENYEIDVQLISEGFIIAKIYVNNILKNQYTLSGIYNTITLKTGILDYNECYN